MLANTSKLVFSAVPSPAAVGGLATGVSQGISDALGNLSQDHNDMGSLLQGIKTDLDSVMKQAGVSTTGGVAPSPLSTGGGGQVADQFRSHVSRLAYITVLHKAIKRTRHQKNFNVDTAMNDLWNALQALKQGDKNNQQIATQSPPAIVGGPQAQMIQNAALMQQMSSMMQGMHQSVGSILNNMK